MYTMVAAPIENHVLGETEDPCHAQQACFASKERGDRWATSDTWSGELLPQRNYSGKNKSKSREKNGRVFLYTTNAQAYAAARDL